MRENPVKSSETLGLYSNGTSVQVLGLSENWYHVQVDGKIGFMISSGFSDRLSYSSSNTSSSSKDDTAWNGPIGKHKTAEWPLAIDDYLAAVSYTHLDVYKRQVLRLAAGGVVDGPAALAGRVALAQGEVEEFLGAGHGHLQGQAVAETGGDGRRQGAAGAVVVGGLHLGLGQEFGRLSGLAEAVRDHLSLIHI